MLLDAEFMSSLFSMHGTQASVVRLVECYGKENRSTDEKSHPISILYNTNPTRTYHLGTNPGLLN